MFSTRKRVTREYKEVEIPAKKLRVTESANAVSYFEKMRTLYTELYKKNQTSPHPPVILQMLCDEYWQEGKKNKRRGQHDLLAKRISQKIIANTHIITALNDVLKDVTLNNTSQFANLLRAFLAYHAQYIPLLNASILNQLKPEPYSFSIDDTDLKFLIGKAEDRKVCRALGNLVLTIPEEHKRLAINELQNPAAIRDRHPDCYHAEDAIPALVKIASASSDEIGDDILKFLIDKNRQTYWESRGSVCKALVCLAHQATSIKKRESLIELLLNFVIPAMNHIKIIGLPALGELATHMPDHFKEKMILHMLSINDFYVPNEDFHKVYCETLVQISSTVSPELNEKIILNLQDRLRKDERYSAGYEQRMARHHFAAALAEIVKRMPEIRQETLVKFYLDKMSVKEHLLGCVIALGKAKNIIPMHLRELVISTLIHQLNWDSDSMAANLAIVSLGELASIIPEKLAKPVIVALCARSEKDWQYSPKALLKLAEGKFSAEIVNYLQNQFYQGSEKEKSTAASLSVVLAKWLPEKLSEDFFILIQNKLDSDERNNFWYMCSNLSTLALSHEPLRLPAVLTLLKQIELGNVNLQGSVAGALAQMSDVIPESMKETVVRRMQQMMKESDVFSKEHACEALGKMGNIIPIKLRESIINELIKQLNGKRWVPEMAAKSLDQLIPIVPKHLKLTLAVKAAQHLNKRVDWGSHKESCGILYGLIDTLPESSIDTLFEYLLKNIHIFSSEIYQKVQGLLERMLDRFPKKWGPLVVNTVCQNTKQWSFVWEPILLTVIRNASLAERNYYLFGVVDSTIARLKLVKMEGWSHERGAEESALLSLIQIKAELCYAWQTEMVVSQRLTGDVTKVVMGYL